MLWQKDNHPEIPQNRKSENKKALRTQSQGTFTPSKAIHLIILSVYIQHDNNVRLSILYTSYTETQEHREKEGQKASKPSTSFKLFFKYLRNIIDHGKCIFSVS